MTTYNQLAGARYPVTGYTPEIETAEKAAAQLAQDLRHYNATRTVNTLRNKPFDCDCGACQRVKSENKAEQKRQAAEILTDAEWLDYLDDGVDIDAFCQTVQVAQFATDAAANLKEKHEKNCRRRELKKMQSIALDENGNIRPYKIGAVTGASWDDHQIHSYTVDGE